MGFYEVIKKNKDLDILGLVQGKTKEDVLSVLGKEVLGEEDLMTLLSPAAEGCLEAMAQRAQRDHLKHFGKAVVLYTPMYISNYCVNKCSYCGFNIDNKIKRKKLTYGEIKEEAKIIAESGLKHILLLTGESPIATPIEYLEGAVGVLKEHFQSITLEIYPLEEAEYVTLIKSGVDGLAVYQETYNEEIYDDVHLAGPKKDYLFRLNTPERGCKAGMRRVGIGALLGLDDWRREVFYTGLHGKYLIDQYPSVEYSFSFPRIKPHVGMDKTYDGINDKIFVQIITALKIFLPYFGTNISTRECAEFRKKLLPIGVSKMSAGVTTSVGGHSQESPEETAQFEISDKSDVLSVKRMISESGYQPVFKNWLIMT